MTTGDMILALAGGAFAGVLAWGLWCDPIRPWIEEQRWRRDQRRLAYRLRDQDLARRATELEVRLMEAHFAMPAAPDPRRLV